MATIGLLCGDPAAGTRLAFASQRRSQNGSRLMKRSEILSLALLVALTQYACVTKPVDGQEVSSRSTTIPYEIYYDEASGPPYVSYTVLDSSGGKKLGVFGGLQRQGYVLTDATGKRWDRGTMNIRLTTDLWYANTDSSHPNAKWKSRLRFTWEVDRAGPRAAITFAGNPDGSLSTATTNCMTSLQSQGGIVVATTCGNGDTVSIYAIGD
jgi:hypothetical protein